MRLFVIFLISFAFCNVVSYLAYKFYKIDISPTIISLALLVFYMMLPDKWLNKINGTE